MNLEQLIEVNDFEAAAREQLEKMAYDYYASGANGQITLRENRAGFDRLKLLPRTLVDVSTVDMSSYVLGEHMPLPLMLAPSAFHRMAHADGELATARAAAHQAVPMMLSTLSSTPLEEVARAAFAESPDMRLWMQVYIYKDRGVTRTMVQRAEAAGYTALALTVDTPRFGKRLADVRNQFHLPPGITVANFTAAGMGKLGEVEGESGLVAYANSLFDPTLTWKDVDWLVSNSRLPVLLKGVLRADDAKRAVEHGAAGVIVSNHGGRQLDTVPATIDALPRVVEAVDGRADVLLDGGVRRGTDILKALALGAQAVFIGRPVLWGLAVAGQAGVERVLQLLREEFETAMMLAGCAKVADVTRDLVE